MLPLFRSRKGTKNYERNLKRDIRIEKMETRDRVRTETKRKILKKQG